RRRLLPVRCRVPHRGRWPASFSEACKSEVCSRQGVEIALAAASLRACHPGLTAVCRKSGDTLKWTAVDQVAAELQDGASAQVAPARARALHALLDEILPEPIGKCRSRRHA